MLDANAIRAMDVIEIRERIRDESEQLRELRFRHAIAQLENPLLLRQKRRLVARLQTVLSEVEDV